MHVDQLVLEADVDRLVDHAFAAHPLIEPELRHQIDSALLQHAGAHATFYVGAAARFEHDAVDALAVKQVREKEPRGTRADNSDLRVHGLPTTKPPRPIGPRRGGFSSLRGTIPETGKRLPEMSMPTRMSGSGDKADLAAVVHP